MASNIEDKNMTTADTTLEAEETNTWHLKALTEALGDLTLNVSDSLSVGRGSDNDVVLGSKQVSRNHALLSVLNGKLYVKDLDSSNGTFVNDARIEGNKSKYIKADDTVGFASFAFQVMKSIVEAGGVEQPVEADEPLTDTESMTIDIMPTASVDTLVEDTEGADAQAIGSEENVAEVTTDKAASPVDEPKVRVDAEPAGDAMSENTINEPVVKETIIEEVLSSTTARGTDVPVAAVVDPIPPSTSEPSMAAEQETVMSNDTSKEPLNKELVNSEPVVSEPLAKEPTVHQEPTTHKEPTVSPEHDKTTKTVLQEEADPDVLRAKQAATAQFSGTANLGQSRDVGTEGNNAMDQAIDNPANAGHVEKKPSGGWFIWVFVAVIIIGLALWLFNMGGV